MESSIIIFEPTLSISVQSPSSLTLCCVSIIFVVTVIRMLRSLQQRSRRTGPSVANCLTGLCWSFKQVTVPEEQYINTLNSEHHIVTVIKMLRSLQKRSRRTGPSVANCLTGLCWSFKQVTVPEEQYINTLNSEHHIVTVIKMLRSLQKRSRRTGPSVANCLTGLCWLFRQVTVPAE